jgi:hypothetical protein
LENVQESIMGKAMGAMAVILMVGGGTMSLFTGLLGSHAEAAALAVMGVGLLGTGRLIGSTRGLMAAKTREAQ